MKFKKRKKTALITLIVFACFVVFFTLLARIGSQTFGGHGTSFLDILSHPAIYI